MQGWFSRFGWTWASAMVLVAAGISQVFSAIIYAEMKEPPAPAVAAVAPAQPAPVIEAPAPDPIPVRRVSSGALSVEILDIHEDRPVEVRVDGCVPEPITLVRRGGSFPIKVHDLVAEGDCTVQARRQDGRYWTRWTQPARVGSTDAVAVALPEPVAGGIGVSMERRGNGALVRSVEPWTPAWQIGLQKGDLITAVDGWSLVGMSGEEMVERITGPAGSRAELTVVDRRTGRTLYRTVDRRPMD